MVVDDTGSPRFIRDGWRKVAEDAGVSFSAVWVRIDAARHRQRLPDNRASTQRHDVTAPVMEAHVPDFDPPTSESLLVVDADDPRNPTVLAGVAKHIRQREHAR